MMRELCGVNHVVHCVWYELRGVSYAVQSMWCELCNAPMGRPRGGHGRQLAKSRRTHPAHEAATRKPRAATWRNLIGPT
eukprot:9357945-Pyramimonas_sp.AAC.1